MLQTAIRGYCRSAFCWCFVSCELIRLRRPWLRSVWRRRHVLLLQVSLAGPATWNVSWGPRLTRRPTIQTTSKRSLSLLHLINVLELLYGVSYCFIHLDGHLQVKVIHMPHRFLSSTCFEREPLRISGMGFNVPYTIFYPANTSKHRMTSWA